MNILIAGGSGLIGQALIKSLKNTNHHITVIGRLKQPLTTLFGASCRVLTWKQLRQLNAADFGAVINLCGQNIGDKRWTPSVIQALIDSRVNTTQSLSDWIIQNEAKPHFICANAVGIYGLQARGDKSILDEDTAILPVNSGDILHRIGEEWQNALQPAIAFGVPVTSTRFGVVLQKNQGMLGKLQFSFSCGLGSLLGDGQQSLSWIDVSDVVNALQFLIQHPEITGPVNVTSPNPVSQVEFARVFARVLNRPLLLTLPRTLVKFLFGEMGDYLLLGGQRVYPKRLLDAGFQFEYSTLESALKHEFQKTS